MSKFKVGDKVTGTNSYQKMYGTEDTISEIKYGSCGTRYRLKNFGNSWWWDEELKLVEAKAEFTFEEVIARIKEGEVYVPLDKSYATKSIAKRNSGNIIITFHKRVDGCVPTYTKYKLVRQKKEYKLYEVEHKEDGKRYLFRSDLDHILDDMVVCDTCQGKSYGKMVKVVTKELTEEEYKAYKPIVKIISKGCPF